MIAWQEIHLRLLRSEWASMEARVSGLGAIQDRIRSYRPWDDRTFASLQILGRVTRCFPDNGSVTARSIDIHQAAGAASVSVSGTAGDQRSLLRTLEQLRRSPEVQDLKVETISGRIPSQFTFSFRWTGGYAP